MSQWCASCWNSPGTKRTSASSTSLGVFPGAIFVRFATRKMCVSTAIVGSPKIVLRTTFAVFRPTPGNASSASREHGTSPPCLCAMEVAVAMMFFALAFHRPMVRMYFESPSTPRAAMASGVRATGNSLRVTAFTLLSVACAERITATSNSNGVWYSSSVVGLGLAARNLSKMARRLTEFMSQRSFRRMGPAFLLGKNGGALARASLDARVVGFETRPIVGSIRQGQRGMRGTREQRDHADAVDRAGCDAQLAAGAEFRDHGVHHARCAHDGVDRAGRQTPGATDAAILVDAGDGGRRFDAVVAVERCQRAPGECRERHDGFGAAGRTLVDIRRTTRDRLGVWATTAVATARALCLRQQFVDCGRVSAHVCFRGCGSASSMSRISASSAAPRYTNPV